jgi:hypothetical protein
MKGVVELKRCPYYVTLAVIMDRHFPHCKYDSFVSVTQSTQNYIGAANVWPAANVMFA